MSAETARKTLVRFASNAASLLASDVLNKATTFLVYALVSRYLGAKEFGQLSLGLLLFYVFQVFATAGLPNLLTREIAKHRRSAARFLTNGLVAAAFTSLLSSLGMLATTWIMGYDRDTAMVILMLSCGLLPYGLALVIEAAFRGREQMQFIAVSNLLANVVKVAGAVVLLSHGYGVLTIAALIVLVRTLILLCNALLYALVNQAPLSKVRWKFVLVLSKRTSTFFGIDAIIAIWSAVDALLLSKLMSEVEVGLYCAALQLLQPVSLVYRSLVGSVFPAMCHRAVGNKSRLSEMTRWLIAFLMLVGLPVTVLIPTFADIILWLAYNEPEFQRAVPIMQVAAFLLVIQCLTNILGHALWASHQERVTLRIVLVNLFANIAINIFMISHYGMLGAAVGSLIVACFNGLQHYLACRKLLEANPVDSQLSTPLVSAALMAATMWILAGHNRYLAAGIGLTIYVLSATTLLLFSHGGWKKLRECFFAPLVSP
jgi:O-antigen/teichoic acid export membrane protein